MMKVKGVSGVWVGLGEGIKKRSGHSQGTGKCFILSFLIWPVHLAYSKDNMFVIIGEGRGKFEMVNPL